MLKRIHGSILGVLLLLATFVTSALAEISPTDEASILTGVASSDGLFYKVGGALLVVMAGIWGFKKVRNML